MSTEAFTITEHLVPGSHIREYPGSTVRQENILKLHVKQYTPKHNGDPSADAITFVATHGVGLPKVSLLYILVVGLIFSNKKKKKLKLI